VPDNTSQKLAKNSSEQGAPISSKFKVSASVQYEYDIALETMGAQLYVPAIELFKKVAQRDSRLSGPWVNIGIAYRILDELDKADEAINTAIKINPKNAYAYNQAGIIMRERGELFVAQEMYQKALAEYPDYTNAHLNLAILCDLYLQKIACAKEHYQTYQALNAEENKQVVAWINELERRNNRAY